MVAVGDAGVSTALWACGTRFLDFLRRTLGVGTSVRQGLVFMVGDTGTGPVFVTGLGRVVTLGLGRLLAVGDVGEPTALWACGAP